MSKIQIIIDSVAGAVGAVLGFMYGEVNGLFRALIAFMILDYVSGVLVAIAEKKLSSTVGFKGIAKKLLILVFLSVGHIADTYVLGGVPVAMTAVMLFYIANEGISIVENASALGLPVPQKIKNVLRQIKVKVGRTTVRTKGIDISRAQEQFDFTAAVSAGVKFVIIRAGIGRDEDTYFRRNIEQCRKLGIDFGCYWYVTATDSEELDRQINACVKAIGDEKPSYPVFCDMEEQRQIDNLTSKERTDMALEFCDRLNKAGLPSGVYANPAWLESYYQKERIVGKRDIWLAHWTESPDYASRYDYGQKIWQWGIDSIAGKDVDGDICFVNYPAITAKWYRENCGDKPDKPVNLFKKGDSVRVKRGARFTNGVEPYSYVYDIIYTVQQVSASGKETLIGIGSVPTGWLYTENLYKAESDKITRKFAVGDKVKVNYGAKTYNGGSLALFVYTNVYEVMQAGSGDREDYIVIGQGGQVTAAVRAEDLTKI